jgi:uncharacterized C2H2 Zn-finger protein
MSFQMFPCPHCPAEFDSLKTLEHHLKASHDDALPNEKFRCVTCDAEFMAQVEWLDHLEDEHHADGVATEAAAEKAAF